MIQIHLIGLGTVWDPKLIKAHVSLNLSYRGEYEDVIK